VVFQAAAPRALPLVLRCRNRSWRHDNSGSFGLVGPNFRKRRIARLVPKDERCVWTPMGALMIGNSLERGRRTAAKSEQAPGA
jgi:hypothetical protein